MSKIAVLNEFSTASIENALQKLDIFPKLTITGLNASQLCELKTMNPTLFESVSEKISSDRWFPHVGVWTDSDEISETALIKNCLYSVRFFLDNFGKKYRVFYGKKIYNNMLPQIVYSSLFDAVVLGSEKKTIWLHGADNFRTLIISAETVNIDDIDNEFIAANVFTSYEELADKFFASYTDFDVITLPKYEIKADGVEKALIKAEKYAAIKGLDKTNDIKTAWISYFNGDSNYAKKATDDIIDGDVSESGDFVLCGDGLQLTEIKLAEDGSGDTVIRVAETNGKEKAAYLMCNRLCAGFRFEIMPYEMPTYRIPNDGKGYAEEIYICE